MGIDQWRHARRGRRTADRFDLAGASELDQLAARVSAITGRAIVFDVTDQLAPGGASGRLDRYGSRHAETADLDVIRLPAEVDDAQREHIALHEIAHILLEHALVPAEGVDLGAFPVMAQLFGAERVQEAFDAYEMTGSAFRTCAHGEHPGEEHEAESFALRMAIRLRRARVPHARAGVEAERARLAERVDRTFGSE